MEDRTTRALGGAAVAGAVLSVLTSVPSAWYAIPDTDAYLFDPAPLSPLWIERTLVPVASVVAVALLLAGLLALYVRDRDVATRPRRWGALAGTVGLGLLAVAMVSFAIGRHASRSGSEVLSVVAILGGALVGLGAVGLLVPGLVAAGVGYARTDRPTVGYALAVGISLSTLVTVVLWIADPETGLGFLPTVVPFAAAFAVVGWELWTHPAPLPEPGQTHDEQPRESAADESNGSDGEATDERPGDGTDDAHE